MCKTSDKVKAVATAEELHLGELGDALDAVMERKMRVEAELERIKAEYNAMLLETMEKYGVKSIKTKKGNTITRKDAYTSRIADTKKMKEEGVYDYYSKESYHPASLQYTGAKEK